MKKIIALFVFLLSIAFTGTISAQTQTFLWQNVNRNYLIRMPDHHDGTPPVVFFLHGLGDNITRLDNEFHFAQIANEYGWAMVAPEARNLGIGNMWNAALMNSDVDDSGFLMALLDSLTAQYGLDPDSVFFTGFSMGGFMTHRMAIEHGDRIMACAPVSGLITTVMAAQTPVTPVRMLHIHGTNDNVVGYNGYSSTFGSNLGLGVDAILQYWQTANGCTGEPAIDTLPDVHNDGLRFVHYTYQGGVDLQHVKVIGGTHTWYLSPNQYDVGYMSLIHDFFVGTAGGTGMESRQIENVQVWPNPSDGLVHVGVKAPTTLEVVDMQGRVVERFHLDATTAQLDLRHLPQGIYVLTIKGLEVAKMVLQH
ncbi:MAG: T9SS type A sorting domain-containing protein [Bacteroidales bacterium]|nr:T9SS type A sorting domain-containing protein [Bacteroidales bacterium]